MICGECGKEVESGSDDPRPGSRLQVLENAAPRQLCDPCYTKAKAEVDGGTAEPIADK